LRTWDIASKGQVSKRDYAKENMGQIEFKEGDFKE
jgi:hypothetical protein